MGIRKKKKVGTKNSIRRRMRPDVKGIRGKNNESEDKAEEETSKLEKNGIDDSLSEEEKPLLSPNFLEKWKDSLGDKDF